MRKVGSIFKTICFILVFLLTGISVFFASTSFAAYVNSYQENANASIAKPVIRVQNGALYRTDENGAEYRYDISDFEDGTLDFYDLRPSDRIDYFFSVNNYYNVGGSTIVNEVKMKVTIVMRVFLKRLTSTGEIDKYFVVGNTFLVGSDMDDQVDMDGSNFSFYKSIGGNLTTNVGDYKNITITPQTSGNPGDFLGTSSSISTSGLPSELYTSDVLKYSGNKDDGFSHYAGKIFEAGSTPTQQAYLMRITLPQQDADKSKYVSSRLFVSVSFNCEQLQ